MGLHLMRGRDLLSMPLACDVRIFFTGDAADARNTHPWALDETCLSLTGDWHLWYLSSHVFIRADRRAAAPIWGLGAACPAGRQRKHRARTSS